jgi:hypothetical protein
MITWTDPDILSIASSLVFACSKINPSNHTILMQPFHAFADAKKQFGTRLA